MFSHKKQKSYELRLARVCLASPSLWLKFSPTLNLSAALATGLDVKGKTKKIQIFRCLLRWWLSYWKLKWVLLQCVSNFGDKLLHRAATFSAAFVCKSSSQPHYHVCVFLCCLFCESNDWKKSCSRFHCGDCCSFKCRRKIKMLFLKVNVTNIPE